MKEETAKKIYRTGSAIKRKVSGTVKYYLGGREYGERQNKRMKTPKGRNAVERFLIGK